MEPASQIIGVVSSVITFIDFTYRFVSLARDIHDQRGQGFSEQQTLQDVTLQFKSLLSQLATSCSGGHGGGKSHPEMVMLASHCHDLAGEILARLEKTQVKKRSVAASLKATALTFWSRNEVNALQTRLDQYVNQLNHHLTAAFRTENKQGLARLSKTTTTMADSMGEVQELLRDVRLTNMDHTKQLMDMVTFLAKSRERAKQQAVINALRFDHMDERYVEISDAAESTYNWILADAPLDKSPKTPDEDPTSALKDWLTKGDGIFHVAGKPGSGKSTLMKFICDHPKTEQVLQEWAGQNNELVTGSFFFWRHGHLLQRTKMGLIRTLLVEILSQKREEIRHVFPGLWQRLHSQINGSGQFLDIDAVGKLSDREIRTAFDLLIDRTGGSTQNTAHRFCFFIDGLDEFDDNRDDGYFDLVELLQKWVNSSAGRIKICVSSRELPVFLDELSAYKRLRLQDLTEGDIQTLVKSTLDSSPHFSRLAKKHPRECNELVEKLVDRSDGVFLWVKLVLKAVKRGLENRDTLKTLLRRVDTMPLDLKEFFQSILASVEFDYLEESYAVFSILMALKTVSDWDPVNLYTYSFLSNLLDDANFAVKLDITGYHDQEDLEIRLKDAHYHLEACCRGLVELRPEEKFEDAFGETAAGLTGYMNFTHRTVPEFLEDQFKGSKSPMYLDKGKAINILGHMVLAHIKTISFPTTTNLIWGGSENLKELCRVMNFFLVLYNDVDTVLRAVAKMNPPDQRAHFELLNLLDQALCSRQIHSCSNSFDINWSKYCSMGTCDAPGIPLPDRCPVISVFLLAAELGLSEYVWGKLDQYPDASVDVSLQAELFEAICSGISAYHGIRDGDLSTPAPGLKMIETFIDRGFDIEKIPWSNSPGGRRRFKSAWVSTIRHAANQMTHHSEFGESHGETWVMLEVCLRKGADPRYRFQLVGLKENHQVIIYHQEDPSSALCEPITFQDLAIAEFISSCHEQRCSLSEFVEFVQPHNMLGVLEAIHTGADKRKETRDDTV